MSASTAPSRAPDPQRAGVVLTKAFLRATEWLGLSQKEVSDIIGVSEATLSRMAGGARRLSVESKEGELARIFLRLARSLDAIVGGDAEAARTWLQTENTHLRGIPAERILSLEGLLRTVDYLDAMRGRL